MKKTNILVDAHIFDDKYQGTRTYLKGIYSSLIPLAKDYHFFLVSANIALLKEEFGEHNNVTYLKLKSKNKFLRLLFEMPSLIKAHHIDYAHFQYISPFYKNCKYIITTHDILFEQKEFKQFFPLKYRFINGFLFKLSAKRADILLTVSEYSKQQITTLYNISQNKIFVTPNAVEQTFNVLEDKIENSTKKSLKTIVYVSRVEPRKNHFSLLKAFLELKLYKQDYTLVLIGSKDFPDKKLVHFIAANKTLINKHVVWEHNLPFNDVKNYYATCSLFVFPSFAEGFGIPILEAMAFNKKILVSNTTAMKDFNLPSELTFNPYDIDDLKNKLTTIIRNTEDYSNLYTNILEKYSWVNSAKLMLDTINLHNV